MIANMSSREFLLLSDLIEKSCGIHIGEDKAYLMESKLSFLLAEARLSSYEELYARCSLQHNEIIEKVIDAITINETFWFRDKTPWLLLEEVLLPRYIGELRSGKKSKIRIWSAACSYGQEPYSIAMCIDHYLSRSHTRDIGLSQFEILATDISQLALQTALLARYDNVSVVRGLDEAYKADYFKSEGKVWHLSDKIKQAVSFRHFNLQSDYSGLGKFDMIFCRNVLIYFGETLKKEVLNKMAAVLLSDGTFIIGSSELLTDGNRQFKPQQYGRGVYYKPRGE